MVWRQACESISESACQSIQAGRIGLNLLRAQEASSSLSLHVFLRSPTALREPLDLLRQ